jgi:creatinine amidohydrolase
VSTFRLAELSFTRLAALERGKTVVIFSVSPLEEHGPHLPVGVDLFNAECFNQKLAERINREKPDWTVLIGPSIPIGGSAFDAPGTLLARVRTVRNVTLDYGAALARHDFRDILVTNGHGGPRHLVALDEAASAVSRRYGIRMLSVSGPVIWSLLRGHYNDILEHVLGRPMTAAEQNAIQGDAHAGLWETSLVMCTHPELVERSHTALPTVKFTLLDALRQNYPLRLGNRMGYIGSPAAASAEFGKAAQQVLIDGAWDIVKPVFEAEDDAWQQTSVFYKIPFLRSSAPYVIALCAVLIAAAAACWLHCH